MTNRIRTIQQIPASIKEVWGFFSDPEKLKEITPPYLDFQIITSVPDKLETGQVIRYRIRPIFRIRMLWETEITLVKDRIKFIDTQRKGPYKLWRHQHLFKEINGGVMMQDIVDYEVPYGFFGRLLNRLFVNRDVNRIFDFRERKIEEIFGKWS